MWQRKELKKRAKIKVKRSYWKMVAICLIMSYFVGSYKSYGGVSLVTTYDAAKAQQTVNSNIGDTRRNSDIVNEMIGGMGRDANRANEKKYDRGVLSGLFNSVTESGSFIFGLLNAFNQFAFKGKVMYGFVICLGVLISFLIWFFIKNVIKVNQCRFFIEATLYEKTPMNRMLFVMSIRKWRHTAAIMFFKELYMMLWTLTIVGGIIKNYSYMMIPYILAENPEISRKDAFALSRQMMRGNKWKAFKLDVSFFGWALLSVVTFGLLGVFYVEPYVTATEAELYMELRRQWIADQAPRWECLNDVYLSAKPIPAAGETETLTYPSELFIIPEQHRRQWIQVDYRRDYTIWSLILLFFTFSIIGWLWEVSLHLTTDGFVNRGVQHGPWLPIYGTGGVLVLVLLKKVREHPLVTFLLTVLICGILEYSTSYYLELTHHGKKWWDYSGYLLNINGRVCAEGLLVFGLGGCAFIYFAAPVFDELYKKIPQKIQIILCLVLLSTFAVDVAYSRKHPNQGKGITDYKSRQEGNLLHDSTQNAIIM